MKKRTFKAFVFATALSATVLMAGCGSASNSTSKDSFMAADGAYETADYGVYEEAKSVAMDSDRDTASGSGEVIDNTNRKLITTVDITAETEDLDTTVANVTGKVKELGGYIESSNIYNGTSYANYSNRNANITARVPADRLDEFVEAVEGGNNITRKSVNVNDVTLTYVDIESRKNSLRTEEKRLLEIMNSADTVEDIIAIEDKLANVRYELESIESQLRSYDNLVDYSTVYLSIEEVRTFTPVEKEGAFARMAKGFVQSLKDVGEGFVEFCVWAVSHIPQLVVLLIVVLVFVLIGRGIIKKSRSKKAKKQAAMQAQYAANMQNMNRANTDTPKE